MAGVSSVEMVSEMADKDLFTYYFKKSDKKDYWKCKICSSGKAPHEEPGWLF